MSRDLAYAYYLYGDEIVKPDSIHTNGEVRIAVKDTSRPGWLEHKYVSEYSFHNITMEMIMEKSKQLAELIEAYNENLHNEEYQKMLERDEE